MGKSRAERKSSRGGAQQRGAQQRGRAAKGKSSRGEEQLRQEIAKKREFFNIYYMKRFFLVLLTMALAVGAYAQGFNPQEPIVNDPSVKVGKLENGLTYYIKHNEKPAQRAEFYIVTNVGAIQETPDQNGLAHFLEHMCFNGTKNFPGKGILSYMESIGAKFGENINAGTGVEITSYMLNNIPLKREGIIDSSLLILHDYAAFVTNDPKEIDAERGVIIEEWRTRRDVNQRMREAFMATVFAGSKYATCNIIGTKENLETFKPESLVNFYKTWYRPDMQAIIVVGDVDVESIEAKIKRIFADLPVTESPKAKEVIKIPDNKELLYGSFVDKECASTEVTMLWKSEPMPDAMNQLKVSVMNDALKSLISQMMNERFKDISKQPNAPFMDAYAGFSRFCATMEALLLSVSAKEGEGLSAFKAASLEMEKAKRYGFTDAEFERAKTNLLKRLENAAENADGRMNGQWVRSYIAHFQHNNAFPTPAQNYEDFKAFLNLINVKVINQLFPKLLTDENQVIIFNAPEKEGFTAPTAEDFKATLAAVAEAEIEAPAVEEANEPLMDASTLPGSRIVQRESEKFGTTKLTLENGIEIYIKPTDFKKDEVIMEIKTEGGYSILPDNLLPCSTGMGLKIYLANSGLANFTESKLDKMLTGKVVNITPFINNDSQGVSASGSPKDFETMLQLAYLIYRAPRFNKDEYEVTLNNYKNEFPNMEKQPNFQFQLAYQRALFSKRNPVMTSELLNTLKIEDVEDVFRRLFSNAAGTKVYIVGNVDIPTIAPLLDKYIGSLPVDNNNALKAVNDRSGFNMHSVENIFEVPMATPKVSIFQSFTGSKLKYNLENQILMTAFNNILDIVYTKSIREDEGGTYGVGTQGIITNAPSDQFVSLIAFDTDAERYEKLLGIAMKGMQDLAENGPSDETFNKVKENLIKAHPEKLIRNSYWKSIMSEYFGSGIDMSTDYIETVNKSLTKENIRKIAKTITSSHKQLVIMKPAAAKAE